ncbi:50S ribosome-binding GTPase domain-containing protein [Ditylenchus destructor]|uniref:50S ribosome-binding GTPase domain-containing protein n=1 Tax=Ditylenchus destructor TaxID=166010 RepID=A0AAD4N4F7_9BILA|nr:50S ribosome-binding GTPase domain-containing protein [Ditylenchus destructor]
MRICYSCLRAVAKIHPVPPVKDVSVVKRDVIQLKIAAGRGGDGLPRYNGVGGTGGSVYLQPIPKLEFKAFCNKFYESNKVAAEHGERGAETKLVGKDGKNYLLKVPLGVECVDSMERLMVRCDKLGQKHLIAKGGEGGCSRNNYKGQPGQAFNLYVHYKLRPNVGMVGFPNAGKSTLLKALFPKKPVRIASYPFTTLEPQMCYLKYTVKSENVSENAADKKSWESTEQPFTLSIADLPGIIEGATRNRGIGFAFLKHLEHSGIIMMIVDVEGFQLNATLEEPYRSALETIALLNREIENYNDILLKKPFVLVLNKVDLPSGREKANELMDIFNSENLEIRRNWFSAVPKNIQPKQPIQFEEVIAISAKRGELGELRQVLKKIHDKINPKVHVEFEEEKETSSDRKILL